MTSPEPSAATTESSSQAHFKDAVLDRLAHEANVAQFVSFAPTLQQRFARVAGFEPNHVFPDPHSAIVALLSTSPERSVNVRSYDPERPEDHPFFYGITDPVGVLGKLDELSSQGLYTIVNETVDVNDGGVSGVALGSDIVEFAPGLTPRDVQKRAEAASLPRDLALRMLRTVYGFQPALDYPSNRRVEFSIHPVRRGVRNDHTIVWEMSTLVRSSPPARLRWPNLFSRLIGDKAYGLLVAHLLGLPVPHTLVIPRKLAPFRFGRGTRTGETWLRTCPTEQQPGQFTTTPHWTDPFELLKHEDPDGRAIASVLAQEGVAAEFSGALLTTNSDAPLIEGVEGRGDSFMLGEQSPNELPVSVRNSVLRLYRKARRALGPVRMEWAHDRQRTWILQCHVGQSVSGPDVIVPGTVGRYHRFDVRQGIDALRRLVDDVRGTEDGIVLVGAVGITSHFGDILRRAEIPSLLERV